MQEHCAECPYFFQAGFGNGQLHSVIQMVT
jgi:hypothetical protein